MKYKSQEEFGPISIKQLKLKNQTPILYKIISPSGEVKEIEAVNVGEAIKQSGIEKPKKILIILKEHQDNFTPDKLEKIIEEPPIKSEEATPEEKPQQS